MIDTFSVISNGIIANDGYKIIDPLGYFVIRVEEIIEEIPEVKAGGGIFYDIPAEQPIPPKRKLKKIRLRVKSKSKNIDYDKELIVGDIDLSVSSVTVVNESTLLVKIKNPNILDSVEHSIKVSITD